MKELFPSRDADPLHGNIGSHGGQWRLERGDTSTPDELRRFVFALMETLCSACREYGAEDIGHVKAHLEHATGFLHANTVGAREDVTIMGRDGVPMDRGTLTVNAVVWGLSNSRVAEATAAALERVGRQFGWACVPIARNGAQEGVRT